MGALVDLPVTYPASIHVDKTRFGIVADTTRLQGHGIVAQALQIAIAETDIDGLTLHVQAAFGDATAFTPQHIVGSR